MPKWMSLADPLANRLLRYWISPYHTNTKNSPFHDRLQKHPTMAETARQHLRQELRLLYVCWTRARDRLILAGREKQFASGILGLLQDEDNQWLLAAPQGNQADWAGQKAGIHTRALDPAEPLPRDIAPGRDYPAVPPVDHPPARQSPSELAGTGQIHSAEKIGPRLPLADHPDMTALGEALHTFFAADRPEFAPNYRLALAEDILHRWQVSASLKPEHLVQAADALAAWIDHHYPTAAWKRELPISHRQDNGTLVSGFIDLLLETDQELVIIDHKAFPGSQAEIKKRSEEYFGQLAAYADCLQEVSSKAVVKVLHYPVAGSLVKIY
ncbi:MAG: PD-(D/E)XK nuclease family protein [Desulfosudaceae bacterium]